MKTALKIAYRDLINSRGFTLLFVFNLFLGICGFVTLHSFRDNINQILGERAKQLLSTDISISGRRGLSEAEEKKARDYLQGKALLISQGMEVYSMVRVAGGKGRSRLVQLKAVDKSFPHYGKITLDKEPDYSSAMGRLQNENVAWLEPALLRQLKVEPGDKIKLGKLEFVAEETVKDDTTASWGGIGLAPKIYISLGNLKQTGLVTFGSVVTHSLLVKLKPGWDGKEKIGEVRKELESLIGDPGIKVRAPESASEQVSRVLNYLSDYLGLVGLVALFLAGIGAGYLFQNYLFEKLQDVAILKSVGMDLRSIFFIYIFQLTALNLLAVGLANFFAWSLLPFAGDFFFQWIGIEGKLGLSWETAGLSFLVSLGASVLICAPVLYKMVSKRVKNLFEGGQFFRWNFQGRDLALFLPLLAFLWGLAILQAHSFKIGSIFTCALLFVSLVVSQIFPRLFNLLDKVWLKKLPLRRPFSLSGGLAARYFVRDRLSSTLSICAVTIGTMLLSLIGQLETSIKGELMEDSSGKPSLFLFDIQEDQKTGLEKLARDKDIPLAHIAPMIRSRILKINNEVFKRTARLEGFSTREEQTSRRFRNRGVNLSFYLKPNEAEEIVKGRPFSGPFQEGQEVAELSIEKRYAERLGIELGDTMTFDILGVEVRGKVVNLRKVKWTSFIPNFFIVFQQGAIDDAPKTYLAAMGEMPFEKRLDAQDLVVEAFPNVSVVNVADVIEKIMNIFSAMALALGVMAGLCMAVGFFVLFAIIQNQLKKKYFEVAIQKVFGIEPGRLMASLLKEYLTMAAISCTLGLGFSLAMGQVVSVLFFDGVWRVDLGYMARVAGGVFLVTTLLVFAAGKTFYSLKVKTLLR